MKSTFGKRSKLRSKLFCETLLSWQVYIFALSTREVILFLSNQALFNSALYRRDYNLWRKIHSRYEVKWKRIKFLWHQKYGQKQLERLGFAWIFFFFFVHCLGEDSSTISSQRKGWCLEIYEWMFVPGTDGLREGVGTWRKTPGKISLVNQDTT